MRLLLMLVSCLLAGPRGVSAEPLSWERGDAGLSDTPFVAVAVDPATPERIVAASRRNIYDSADGGETWRERFRLPGTATVSALAVDSAHAVILVATDRGLYGSSGEGARWSRVFRGRNEDEAHCTAVAFHPRQHGTILLGTRGGLFISVDHGRRWRPVPLPRAARQVAHVAFHPDDPASLYLLTDERLFIGNLTTEAWQERLNILLGTEDTAEELFETPDAVNERLGEDSETAVVHHHLTAIAVDPGAPQRIYLAGTRGVVVSLDGGTRWQRVTRVGLQSPVISRLLPSRHSPLVLYAATDRGVARYEPERARWEVITQGLSTTRINDLALTPQQLWAATDQGLSRAQTAPLDFGESEPPSPQELLANFAHEPTMAQVREAAIRYAEVSPEKIARWRRQAALRALFPQVDVGVDRDHSRTAHYDEGTFPKFQIVETDDRDSSMDLSITWELGDLLWSDDQTSIDVRSKLMVQLRNDIVDEVTRTYFERRRLQVTLLTTPPTDDQELLEQELRLQELTALIDGLTGGYFSKRMEIK